MRTKSELASYVTEQLAFLGRISNRGIFGGIGIFIDERLLGIVVQDALYLHTDDANREEYLVRGMAQFKPYPNAFDLTTDHHQVPADVLRDPGQLKQWGERALTAAVEAAKAKQRAGIDRARRVRLSQDTEARRRRKKAAEDVVAQAPKPRVRSPRKSAQKKSKTGRTDFLARQIEALLVDVHGKKKTDDGGSDGGTDGST